jgi:hypothetical protein
VRAVRVLPEGGQAVGQDRQDPYASRGVLDRARRAVGELLIVICDMSEDICGCRRTISECSALHGCCAPAL